MLIHWCWVFLGGGCYRDATWKAVTAQHDNVERCEEKLRGHFDFSNTTYFFCFVIFAFNLWEKVNERSINTVYVSLVNLVLMTEGLADPDQKLSFSGVYHLTFGVDSTMSSQLHRTLGRMQECYQLVLPGREPIIKKGRIEPIDISVASRGSNKKVTTYVGTGVFWA